MGKAKEKAKSTKPSKKWEAYSNGKKEKRECPKCGKGIFLGHHKSPERYHCGKCSYTEFVTSNN